MKKTFTRRELYDLVWSKPISKIAPEFGISDVALHKVCEKHRVPRPPRGYWAKVAAGRPATKTLFRDISDQSLNDIQISESSYNNMPERVKRARTVAEAALAETKSETSQSASQASTAKYDPFEITRVKFKKAKADQDGIKRLKLKNTFALEIGELSLERALDTLRSIHDASERCGYHLVAHEGGLGFKVGEDAITLTVTEQLDKTPYKPTPAKQKRLGSVGTESGSGSSKRILGFAI